MPNPNCPLCEKPLGDFEVNLNHKWHKECAVCKYCKRETTREMVETVLDKPSPASQLFHVPCHEKQLMAEFKDDKLPLVQEHLDVLNKFILSQHTDEIALDLEHLYPLLRNLQQAAANVSIAIARKRDKIRITESEIYRTKTAEQKAAEREERLKDEKEKIRRVNEKADPALRVKRKAIEGLMSAFKMTEAQALEMLSKQQGKAN